MSGVLREWDGVQWVDLVAETALGTHVHAEAEITGLVPDLVAVKARANHTGTQLAATVSDFSTAADARIAAFHNATLLSTTSLDTLNTTGVFYQDNGSYATPARGYPMQTPGTLEVVAGAGIKTQRFTTAVTGVREFVRYWDLPTDLWQPWVEFQPIDQPYAYGAYPASAPVDSGTAATLGWAATLNGGFAYDGPTGVFTVPVTGWYRLSLRVSYDTNTGGSFREAWLELAGVGRILDCFATSPGPAIKTCRDQRLSPLTAGALLKVVTYHDAGGPIWIIGQNGSPGYDCFIQMEFVHY
jgi:hypothetical protein